MSKKILWDMLHPVIRLIERSHLVQILPRDRILSASSINGSDFKIDSGVRVDVHDCFGSDMIYRCALMQDNLRNFMFYNASRYGKGAWRNRIIRTESNDQLRWLDAKKLSFIDNGLTESTTGILVQSVTRINEYKLFLYGTLPNQDGGSLAIVRYESENGLSWVKAKPYVCIPCGLDPFLIKVDKKYAMYYSAFGQLWESDSSDGINWQQAKSLALPSKVQWRYRIGGPSIIDFNGYWHLYFHGADNDSPKGINIWHAISRDRKSWDFLDTPVLESGCSYWAGDGVAWPYPIKTADGKLRLYFTAYWGRGVFVFKTQRDIFQNK